MLMVANPVKMAAPNSSRGGGARDSMRTSSHAGRSSIAYGGSSIRSFQPGEDEFWEIDLTIHQGDDLAAKDRNVFGQRTTSDPYIQVDLLPEGPSGRSELALGLTRILFKTLTPKWGQGDEGEHFKACIPASQLLTTCRLRHNNAQLRLKIYDHDDDSSDDLMGIVSIPISEPVHSKQEWYDVPETSARNASGRIQCTVKIEVKSKSAAMIAAEKDPQLKLGIHVMSGQYLAAKDRNALGKRFSSDPYVKLDLLFFRNSTDPLGTRHGDSDQKVKPFQTIKLGKTKIKSKTLSPIWNEKFDTILCQQTNSRYDPEQVQVKLQLTIMDHDYGSDDDLMGIVTIPIMVHPLENQIIHHWYAVPPDSCRHASGRMQILMESEWLNLKNKDKEPTVEESPEKDTESSSQPTNNVGGDILNYLYKNAAASVDSSFKTLFAMGTVSTTNDKAGGDNNDDDNGDDEEDRIDPKTKASPTNHSSTELGDDDEDDGDDNEPNPRVSQKSINPFASTNQVKKIGQRSGIQSRRMTTTNLRGSTNSLRASSSSNGSTRKIRSSSTRPSSSPNLLELGKGTDDDDDDDDQRAGTMRKSASSHCLPPRSSTYSAGGTGRRMKQKTRKASTKSSSSRVSDGLIRSLGSSEDVKKLSSKQAHEEDLSSSDQKDLSSSDQSRRSSKSRTQRRGSEEVKARTSSQHRRSSSTRLLDSPSKDPTSRRRSRRPRRTTSMGDDEREPTTDKTEKDGPKFARQRSRSLETGTPRRISNRRSSSRHLRSGLASSGDGMDAKTQHTSNTSSDKRRASGSKLPVESSLPRVTREKGPSTPKVSRSQSRSSRAQRSKSFVGFESLALGYNDEPAASPTKKSGSKSMRRQRSSSMGFGTSTTSSIDDDPTASTKEKEEKAGPKFSRQRSRSLEPGTPKRHSKSRSSSRHLRSVAPTDDPTSSTSQKDGPKLTRQRSRSLEPGTPKRNSKSRSSSRHLRSSSPTDELLCFLAATDGPKLTRQRSRSLEPGTPKGNSKSRSSSRHLRSGSPTDDPKSSSGDNTETGPSKRSSKSRSSSRHARSGSPTGGDGEEANKASKTSSSSMKRRPSSGKLLVDSSKLRSTREKGPSTAKDPRSQSKSRKPRRSTSMSDDPTVPVPEKTSSSKSMRRQRSSSMGFGTSTTNENNDPTASSKGKTNLRASTGSSGAPNLRASTGSSGTGRGSSSKRSK